MSGYSEAVLERYYSPKYCGCLEADNETVRTGQVGTADNGEVIRLQLQVGKDGTIAKICFKAHGSCATIAAAMWVCEQLDQQPLAAIDTLTHQALIEALDLPNTKLHSALLAIDAAKAAKADHLPRQ